jgi:hypothetical protein
VTIVRPPQGVNGCCASDLFIDQAAQLARQQDGIVLDREVCAAFVSVESVGGQFDEAGDGKGVEPDQCARDPYSEWKFVVVEASSKLSVVLLFTEEPGEQTRPSGGDGDLAGQGPSDLRL